MNKYLTIINYRTLIALSVAFIMLYLAFTYDIYYHIDLTLLSIAIIFPLVFNIRGSFRRREKALEHLSQFRGALKTIYYFFISNDKLSVEDQLAIKQILLEISNHTIEHLSNRNSKTDKIDASLDKVSQFILSKDKLISSRSKDKIYRFMNDLHESVENLHAIHVHRTPISLKAYCEFFIYTFPIIYVPAMIYNVGIDAPKWITIVIVIFSEFILISLFNIQDQMEYPFDDIGLDDINLNIFKFDR